MKKNNPFLRAVPVCLALTLALTPLALAAEPELSPSATVYNSANTIEPRFQYISRISSGMTISTSGYASCTGSYTMYKGMDGTITVTLQRNENGRWTDYGETSKDFSGDGAKVFQTGWDVSKGYRYRAVTVVEIKDASGNVVETATCDSPIQEY